jgi:hypothetical protein
VRRSYDGAHNPELTLLLPSVLQCELATERCGSLCCWLPLSWAHPAAVGLSSGCCSEISWEPYPRHYSTSLLTLCVPFTQSVKVAPCRLIVLPAFRWTHASASSWQWRQRFCLLVRRYSVEILILHFLVSVRTQTIRTDNFRGFP